MPIFIIVRITLIRVIILIRPISVVVGVVLIRIVVELRLTVRMS